MIRDYGYLLRDDPRYAAKAARVSELACDISELLERIGLPPITLLPPTVVGYHAACSLQHGLKVADAPARLLRAVGFDVRTPQNAHLCCGSAGAYSVLNPEISDQLKQRKLGNLQASKPEMIARAKAQLHNHGLLLK